MTLPPVLYFDGAAISIIDRNGRAWITQTDLTKALYGIKDGEGVVTSDDTLRHATQSVNRLFNKNKDEFSAAETATLTMETDRGPSQVRIYSTRGCRLMGMLAKTPSGRLFRVKILDTLEAVETQLLSRGAPLLLHGLKPEKMDAEALAAMKARTAAGNLAMRSLGELRRVAGSRTAAKAVPQIFATFGVNIDAADCEPSQGDILLDAAE